MKTKAVTVQRNQERSFDIAMLDFKFEYDSIVGDDILDEIAFSETIDDDE